MRDTEDNGAMCGICVPVEYDHSIVVGMPKDGKVIASFTRGSTITVTKVSIQHWHYYVIQGVAGYEFSIGVLRPMLNSETVRMLRESSVHECWDHVS